MPSPRLLGTILGDFKWSELGFIVIEDDVLAFRHFGLHHFVFEQLGLAYKEIIITFLIRLLLFT